jgi:hypothetical protein
MKLVVLNNLLDLFSFFLVTIDLYGRKRFEQLAEQLRHIKFERPPSQFFTRKILWKQFGRILSGPIPYWQLLVIDASILTASWASTSLFLHWLAPELGEYYFFSLLALLYTTYLIVAHGRRYIIFVGAKSIRSSIMALLAPYGDVEGKLVFVGALLFVVSRCVSIYAGYTSL